MKSFRTEIKVAASKRSIGYDDQILALGSCFADAVGELLHQHKFRVLANPQGPAYHPLAIHKIVQYILHNELPLDSSYVESQGVWHNFEFHSRLSAASKKDIVRNLTDSIGLAHHFAKSASVLIITYGTAKVHCRAKSGEPVANCHKLPASEFRTEWLTPESIAESFHQLYHTMKQALPELHIILTVSPVRHLRDTLELNSVSKSILRLACHHIQQQHPDVDYFPAFEILIDDLRDYRFYDSDMIHPSADAVEYIWDKFTTRYFSEDTQQILHRWKAIARSLNHRPFHESSEAHQLFVRETLRELEELKAVIPVEEEIERLTSQLHHDR